MLDHATGIVVGRRRLLRMMCRSCNPSPLGGTGKRAAIVILKREGDIGAGAKISAAISRWGAQRKLAQVPVVYSSSRRTLPPQAFRRVLSASRAAISRRWIWTSISTGYTIRLSMATAFRIARYTENAVPMECNPENSGSEEFAMWDNQAADDVRCDDPERADDKQI